MHYFTQNTSNILWGEALSPPQTSAPLGDTPSYTLPPWHLRRLNSAPSLRPRRLLSPAMFQIKSRPCISLAIFQIFDGNTLWPRFRTVLDNQGQRSWFQSVAHGSVHIRHPLTVSWYVTVFFGIFDVDFYWPWSRTVQGLPAAEFIVSNESP